MHAWMLKPCGYCSAPNSYLSQKYWIRARNYNNWNDFVWNLCGQWEESGEGHWKGYFTFHPCLINPHRAREWTEIDHFCPHPKSAFFIKKKIVVWDTWMIHLVFKGNFIFALEENSRVHFKKNYLESCISWAAKTKKKFFSFLWLISFSFNNKSSWVISVRAWIKWDQQQRETMGQNDLKAWPW